MLDVDLPPNAHREGPLLPIATLDQGHLAPKIASRSIENLVRVAMITTSMRMRCTIMCMRHFGFSYRRCLAYRVKLSSASSMAGQLDSPAQRGG